ncbi:hypothetical protein ACSC9U_18290 [Pseudomonas solani]|uniref:hypothetical protein n=1 Tax=Pseudomonas solani TaxID=2731552 RepID=UPI003F4AB7B0
MTTNATSIKSIKFYCAAPNQEAKSTYHAVGQQQASVKTVALAYRLSTDVNGFLEVHQEGDDGNTKVFIYKLPDILGRIEVLL